MANLPNQRVSNSTKQTEKWYKDTYDYWVNKAEEVNDKDKTKLFLQAASGVITEETYKYVSEPLSANQNKTFNLPGEIRNVDFITPIKEKNIGEYIELPYKFQVVCISPDVVINKTSDIQMAMIKYIQQEVINYMNENKVNTGVETIPQPPVEKYMQDFIDSWVDDRVKLGQDTLNLINAEIDFDIKRIQNFFNWWSTEEFYTYRYVENGRLYEEVISPIEGYPIVNSEAFVEDYDGFVVKRNITFQQFFSKYRNKIKLEDLEAIRVASSKSTFSSAPTSFIPPGQYDTFYSATDETFNSIDFGFTTQIDEQVICFKTETKRYILSYYDELGNISEKFVTEEYELNPEVGDISITIDWVPEVWIGVRWQQPGNADWYYLPPEPAVVQRYDTQGNCKLPFGGKKGMLRGNVINPIPNRLLPYLALFRIYTLQQERAIAKYKGDIEVIPKAMLDDDEIGSKGQFWYMKADNTIIYDNTKISPQDVAQGFKIVGNPGLEKYIVGLNELRKQIMAEAYEVANMNEQRAGNIDPQSGKGVTDQAIFRAKLGSVLMVQLFNKALEKDHLANLEFSKIAYADGKQGSYIDKNNKPIYVQVDPYVHLNAKYGVYVSNAQVENEKLQLYKQIAFNASQNGDFDSAFAAIDADETASIRESIKQFKVLNREYEIQMQKLKNAPIEAKNELTKYKIETDYQKAIDVANINAGAKVNQPDSPEPPVIDNSDKQRALDIKEREMADKRSESMRKDGIKREEIASKERIAKMNKN